MSPDPDADLTRLRAIALALPEASEKPSHGSPGFFVEGGRAFAYFRHDHHGDGLTIVIVKTAGREEQDLLVERDPHVFSIPSYLGAAGWIAMRVGEGDPDWDHIADRVAQSWEMVAPTRLLEAGGR